MMLSCKEVVKIVSSEDRSSWMRRAQLRLHVMMCRHCGAYIKQLDMIKDGARALFHSHSKDDEERIKSIEDRTIEKIKSCDT